MENEKEKDTALTFGVDLNKKEYILFGKTISSFTAGKRLSGFFLIGLAVFVVLTLAEMAKEDIAALLSADVLSLLVFAVLCIVGWLVLPPLFEKRRYAKGYEDAVAGGQVFEGMVTVNTESITKVTVSGTLTLSFDDNLLFVQHKDALIFVNRLGQGIVLPARCLTAEDAAAVRKIAEKCIHPRFFVVKSEFVGQRAERMLPADVTPVTTRYTVNIVYNDAEQKTMLRTLIRRDIFRTAPIASGIAFCAALTLGEMYGFSAAAILFAVAVVLFIGIKCLFWAPRYKAVGKSDTVTLSVLFTDRAVVLERQVGPGKQRIIMQWKEIAHAVEGEEAVEIYNRSRYLYIPKRHIGDMDFLRDLVNEKMKRPARERNE